MRADVVQAEELAAHVKQDDHAVTDLQGLAAGIGQAARLGDTHEVGHSSGHSYSRTRLAIARPRASRTLSMVIRSNTCWKNPVTIMRVASLRVNPRHIA